MEDTVYMLVREDRVSDKWEIYSQTYTVVGTYLSLESAKDAAEKIANGLPNANFIFPLEWKSRKEAGIFTHEIHSRKEEPLVKLSTRTLFNTSWVTLTICELPIFAPTIVQK